MYMKIIKYVDYLRI